MDYQGKKVAILGFGVEGQAAYEYWAKQGSDVTIHDLQTDLKLPLGAKSVLGEGYLKNLDDYDLVVRSPGVLPYKFSTTAPVTSVIDEFLAKYPAHTIGVTGTKGKSTTCSLIYHILKYLGKTVYLSGNIGDPPLKLLPQLKPDDLVVLELSNVQLWDVTHSPEVAVLLAIEPEHLDWHRGNVAEYVATKANITRFQTTKDLLIYYANNQEAVKIAGGSNARKQPFPDATGAEMKDGQILYRGQIILPVSDIALMGKHNLANVCAALAVVISVISQDGPWEGCIESIREAIKDFKGLEHRLQLVAEIDGVKYYDDSASTHPGATISALEAVSGPKVLIAGGASKGVGFKKLAEVIATGQVKKVVLIGETAIEIEKELQKAGFSEKNVVNKVSDMKEVISSIQPYLTDGDSVLLSPGCASFGMFNDYKDRAAKFVQAVQEQKNH